MWSIRDVPSADMAAISMAIPARMCHVIAFELAGVVVTDYNCTVRITEDDLRAHVNQFVHKEKTGFEHLLVDKNRAFCLCGYHEKDRQQVRRQTRPRRIGHRKNRAIEEGLNLIVFLCRNNEIIPFFLNADSQTAERIGNDSKNGTKRRCGYRGDGRHRG